MLEKDKNALRYVNFGIFKDDIFDIGEDFIEYISKFTALSAQMLVIANHNPKLLEILSQQISTYESLADNFDEMEVLITYFARKCFDINLTKDINANDLMECAFRNSTSLNPKIKYEPINVQFGENYQDRLQQEYSKRYGNASNVDEKLNLYLDRVFSITKEGAERFIKEYGSDIENIKGVNEEEKNLIYQLKEAINIRDEKEIDLLFAKAEGIYRPTHIFKARQNIAKACAKSHASEMEATDKHIQRLGKEDVQYIEFNGQQVQQIKLVGNFNMLLHSTDTGFISETHNLDEQPDFVQLWKSGENKENHVISTTLVNQDFLGTSPVGKNGVRYGFTTVQESSIRLMGVTDINTYSSNFAYDSAQKQYMSAKTLPYNSRRVYSEFGIERDGTNPDYVVIFDDDIPEVKNNSYQAAVQFGIPVVFIDKRKIEKQQMENLKSFITRFNEEGNVEDLKTLINCYETNRAGWLLNRYQDEEDNSFTSSIDNSGFEKDFDVMAVEIETLVKGYLSSIKEGKSDYKIQELASIMEILLKEIELYSECDKTKPISKTQISFEAYGLVKEVNDTLQVVGENEYMVDMDKLPSSEEYQLTMKQIVANALTGKNSIDIDDVARAMKTINLLKERGELQNDK